MNACVRMNVQYVYVCVYACMRVRVCVRVNGRMYLGV